MSAATAPFRAMQQQSWCWFHAFRSTLGERPLSAEMLARGIPGTLIGPGSFAKQVASDWDHEHPDADPIAALTPVVQAAKSVRDIAGALLPERK